MLDAFRAGGAARLARFCTALRADRLATFRTWRGWRLDAGWLKTVFPAFCLALLARVAAV
jgi:hypothetical protein